MNAPSPPSRDDTAALVKRLNSTAQASYADRQMAAARINTQARRIADLTADVLRLTGALATADQQNAECRETIADLEAALAAIEMRRQQACISADPGGWRHSLVDIGIIYREALSSEARARKDAQQRVIEAAQKFYAWLVLCEHADLDCASELGEALTALDQHNPSTKAQEREG